jgi:hypothetical protein
VIAGSAGDRYVGVRFPSGVLPALIGVPAADLRDARVPLPEVTGDPRARLLAERAAEAADPGRALELFALWRSGAVADLRTPDVVPMRRPGTPGTTVADQAHVAREARALAGQSHRGVHLLVTSDHRACERWSAFHVPQHRAVQPNSIQRGLGELRAGQVAVLGPRGGEPCRVQVCAGQVAIEEFTNRFGSIRTAIVS